MDRWQLVGKYQDRRADLQQVLAAATHRTPRAQLVVATAQLDLLQELLADLEQLQP